MNQNQNQNLNKENIDSNPQKSKKISKILKKQKLVETMKKLTKQIKDKLTKFNCQNEKQKDNVICLKKNKEEKVHQFICYKDEEIVSDAKLRSLIIKRKVDNDAQSDDEQLHRSIKYLHHQLLWQTNEQNQQQ